MRFHIDMSMEFPREKVLATLKQNRETHSATFQEAREGYINAARDAVASKLKDLENGKFTGLNFRLTMPQDMTAAYDTAISMLELSEAQNITLTAQTYRQFVLDEWDWMDNWLLSNAAYSKSAADIASAKGLM